MRRPGELWIVQLFELVLWKSFRADDHLVCGESDKRKRRCQQHAELGDDRSHEDRHHAGDIHLDIGKRFSEHEPNGNDRLHADGNQCFRLDHGDADG